MPDPIDTWVPRRGADRPGGTGTKRHTFFEQLAPKVNAAGVAVEMTTEFQAAIDALPQGAVLELAPGTYIISRTLVVNRLNVTIRSQGQHAATVQVTDGGTTLAGQPVSLPCATFDPISIAANGVVIEGINFSGTNIASGTHTSQYPQFRSGGMCRITGSGCVVRRCKYTNCFGIVVHNDFANAVAAATTGSGVEVLPGVTRMDINGAPSNTGIRVERALTIRGCGGVFYVDDDGTEFPQGVGASHPSFVVGHETPTTNVVFDGITFQGKHYPFTGINNLVTLSSSTIVFTYTSHCVTRNCTFNNMFGHVVRSGFPGTQHHIDTLNCTVYECSNGININADDSRHEGNTITRANGIESHGDRNTYINNTFVESTGLSIGGKGGPASTVDVVVRGNIMTRVWKGAGIGLGGCDRALVENCTVTDASWGDSGYMGIQINASTAENVPGWIEGPSGANTVRNCTITSVSGGHGIWVQTGTATTIEDCTVDDAAGFVIGILVQASGTTIRRCVVRGGSGDISLQSRENEPITVTLCNNTGAVTEVESPGGDITIITC